MLLVCFFEIVHVDHSQSSLNFIVTMSLNVILQIII